MKAGPTDELVRAVARRGLAGPVAILLDAHRPLQPLLAEATTFLAPLLRPLLGPRHADLLRAISDRTRYARLVERLRAAESGEADAEHR